MMIKKRIITGLAALVILMTICLTAFAAEQHTAEEIEEYLWSENWHGKGDNGLIFPEASYKHHILEKWVDENYDDIKGTPLGRLKYQYGRYYKQLVKDYDFNDDKNGNWTIKTSDDEYHFSLINGDWQMINQNNEVVDTFPPFSTLSDDETTAETTTANANEGVPAQTRIANNQTAVANNNHADSGKPVTASSGVPAVRTAEKKQTNPLMIAVGILTYILVGVIGFFIGKKKK